MAPKKPVKKLFLLNQKTQTKKMRLVVLVLLVAVTLALQISQEDNQKLWSTYQYVLYSKLKEMQCRSVGCAKHQAFQIIDSSQNIAESEV